VDERYHSSVLDSSRQYLYQFTLVDRVEELLQVHVNGIDVAFVNELLAFPKGLVGTPPGAESVARLAELTFVNRGKHLRDGLLYHPIHNRGDAQQAFLPVVFGDFHPSHRIRAVLPTQDRLEECLLVAG